MLVVIYKQTDIAVGGQDLKSDLMEHQEMLIFCNGGGRLAKHSHLIP